MAHGQGEAKKDKADLPPRGPGIGFPGTQLQAVKGDWLAVRKTPCCCLLRRGHILKHFLSWGGEVTLGPPLPRLLMKCGW